MRIELYPMSLMNCNTDRSPIQIRRRLKDNVSADEESCEFYRDAYHDEVEDELMVQNR